MKRILLFIAAGLVVFLVSVPSASAFGWKDVVKMHRAGIADSLIVQKIEYSGKAFRLSADDMAALKAEGISDEVISAMLRTEADEGPYYDYDSYGYYDYPHSHVYMGFGLGYHYYPYRWYYDGYYGGYNGYPYYSSRYYFRRHGGYYGNHGYTGYRGWTGNYGDTRYRSHVGDRIYTGNRGGYTGNRGYTRDRGYTGGTAGHSQPGSGRSGQRTRTR